MKKKVIAFALLTAVSMSLVGCNFSEKVSTKTNNNETTKTEDSTKANDESSVKHKMTAFTLSNGEKYEVPEEFSIDGHKYVAEIEDAGESISYYSDDTYLGINVTDSDCSTDTDIELINEVMTEALSEDGATTEISNVKSYTFSKEDNSYLVYISSSGLGNSIVVLSDSGTNNYLMTIILDMEGVYDLSTDEGIEEILDLPWL